MAVKETLLGLQADAASPAVRETISRVKINVPVMIDAVAIGKDAARTGRICQGVQSGQVGSWSMHGLPPCSRPMALICRSRTPSAAAM